jgi:hypothetical protein
METCLTQHATCHPAQKDGDFKPTRLLHIPRASDFIQLRERDEIPLGVRYTTLSHCWGQIVLGKLEAANLCERKRGIPLESLVKTFRDAVDITKRLGVEYIWIDSLCIVQDSREDWEHESLLMGPVYGNSYCDIAATASSDGRGGCFRARDPHTVLPCLVTIGIAGKRQLFYLSDVEVWSESFAGSPLNVRAWVLQERLLSPRVLHFDSDQLVWECNEMIACERHPRGVQAPLPLIETPRNSFLNSFIDTVQQNPERAVLDAWAPVVSAYSACGITRDTDRLIALSGVAMKIRELLPDSPTYSSGLWMRNIERQLTWRVVDPRRTHRPTEHIAPSWSWASVVGQVALPQWDEKGSRTRGSRFRRSENQTVQRTFSWTSTGREFLQGSNPATIQADEHVEDGICKLLEIKKPSNSGNKETSFISHDQLRLRCYLIPITIIPVSRDDWKESTDSEVGGDSVEDAPDDYPRERRSRNQEGYSDFEEEDFDPGEDEDQERSQEGEYSSDNVDGEEEAAPWVTYYTNKAGQQIDLYPLRTADVDAEWSFATEQERWLLPTSTFKNGDRVYGIILERVKSESDMSTFHRCGMFVYGVDFEYGVDQHSAAFWECCIDFVNGDGSGLERRDFKCVPRPVVVASKNVEGGRSTVIGFEHSDETARQFVITLE